MATSPLTTAVSKIAPSAANGVTLTSGISWASGSYGQLLAATAATAWLTQINFDGQPTGVDDYELDIATGGAGSEVVLATIPYSAPGGGAAVGGEWAFTLPAPISGIASGARIAARLREAGGSAKTQDVAITYIESSTATNASTTGTAVVPSAANNVSVTPSASAFANSAFTQLTAGINHETQWAGLDFNTTAAIPEYEFDLATGGAGSETVLTTIRGFGGTGTQSQITYIQLLRAYAIAKNLRVAVRMRKGGTSTTAYTFKLAYYTNVVLSPSVNPGKGGKGGHGKGGPGAKQIFGPNLFVTLDTVTGYGSA